MKIESHRNAIAHRFFNLTQFNQKVPMMTKNLSNSCKSKINGKRLPPIPIVNDTSTSSVPTAPIVTNPVSILKKPKPIDSRMLTNEDEFPLDDDDPDTSRVIFRKSPADVLLLLDTYPPKTWTTTRCLQSGQDLIQQHNHLVDSMFDPSLSSAIQRAEFVDQFPAPLSDRLPSSRYCRRSVSSACSRRSSILFSRHTTSLPLDTTLQREDTFDTVCESLTETVRQSYTPLPPIAHEPPNNLSKSLTVPADNQQSSISPPLITAEETLVVQKKKEEFTRRLLSRSLHRDSSATTNQKQTEMDSPSNLTQKQPLSKPVIPVRNQRSVVEHPRFASAERVPVANTRPKPTNPVNTSIHVNSSKLSLDIFQPQSKSTTSSQLTSKRTTPINSKAKPISKATASKTKGNASNNEESVAVSIDDNSIATPTTSSEATPVTNVTVKMEAAASKIDPDSVLASPKIEESTTDILKEHKPVVLARRSTNYTNRCIHPVPKPLTLQGEKDVDPDYLRNETRLPMSTMSLCQRRGSLKGQPVITEMFAELVVEPPPVVEKVECRPIPKATPMKLKKRGKPVKSAKAKKPAASDKLKRSNVLAPKIELKTSPIDETQEKSTESKLVVGGTDWILTMQPQIINNDQLIVTSESDVPTVDDEDLPSCASPDETLNLSQTTVMNSSSTELVRRNSMESVVAMEISPVLSQIIEQQVDLSPFTGLHTSKAQEETGIHSDIRAIYENVQDSIRKDSSLRATPLNSSEQDTTSMKNSTSVSNTSLSSRQRTLPFDTSLSTGHTYNNSESDVPPGPAFRVVNDSLNSRGSETTYSTSSQEDYGTVPLFTEADCDEIYRTARKGRQVGRGAFGIVWSYLTITGRVIAVKEIELDDHDSEHVRDDYESVREEVIILRGLNHPYIVKFLGISLENNRLIKIFMEYLPNGTIENLLVSFGPFHNDILKKYTRQIVEGVAYLHENGVVHRDIKGKNIMLDVDGNIKLIDFGCAKRLKKNQNTHSMRQLLRSMKGTANWMAPEVIAETGHGKKADIWSIGCTLCEMATGKPPWSSEHNHLAVLLIIANGTKPPAALPDTCPESAQQFFNSCLTRDPSLRPSAKDLLSHPFLTS